MSLNMLQSIINFEAIFFQSFHASCIIFERIVTRFSIICAISLIHYAAAAFPL